ncbi:endothelin-converting enzyme homolog isoform X1 [Neodiprion pinetum]|uniref:endothelin-converting enzyme homolog isoform X1 n=1 Tax=Neodiprion pinetum TaxID=441929 RepID=UPI001EDF97CB|nr:neprilysin-4-like isoform X1 [Neodiprion pinetum]
MLLDNFTIGICICLALPSTILSTRIHPREAFLESVPWFIVEKYKDEISNLTGKNWPAESNANGVTKSPSENDRQSIKICQTEDCRAAAENFITNMDSTVDPCEDFFGFVCGGWPSAHPLPPTESSWDQFAVRTDILNQRIREILEEDIDVSDLEPVKSAKSAYRACMNTDAIERKGIDRILAILDENGGWPIMLDASRRRSSRLSWQQIEENYSREYDTDSIYGIVVDVDLKNASVYSIYMDQASTILPRSMITDNERFSTIIDDYVKYVENVAFAFAKSRNSRVPRERVSRDAMAIVKFETELAKISSPDEMRRDLDRLYNPMSIQHLQNWYNNAQPKTFASKVNWLKTVQNQFNDVKINVESTERIIVMEVDYYFKLATLLDKTPSRTIVNYLHWRMVNSLLPSTTEQMRNITFEIEKKVFGIKEQRKRWMTCVTDNNMKHAISYQYVKKFVNGDAKKTASDIVSEMQEEFKEQISRSTWMDEKTKLAAKGKLRTMKRFISHPDWYHNETAMIHYYKGLVVTQDHFENTVTFKQYERKKKFRKYGTPVDEKAWLTEAITINAYYDPNMNSLTFPAGILQVPFFSAEVPDSLNYGSIGTVIGHEISHGFDDVGRQFDKAGNANQWWSDGTIKAFKEKAKCFVDQYNNYTIDEISTASEVFRANGELTQGENIADSTGLEASYEIFKKRLEQKNGDIPRLLGLESFTHDQLFFISFGNTWCETVTKEYLAFVVASDAHPTNRLRVIGTLGNSEGFNKAFNCSADSRMNRLEKCNLWK